MKNKFIKIFPALLLFILYPADTFSKEKLMVGTKIAEPFVMQSEDGNFNGAAIQLFNQIAGDLNYEVVYKKYDLEGLIKAVSISEVDIGVAPLTITAEREELIDFTHPYYVTGLSIAVHSKDEDTLFQVLRGFFSTKFLGTIFLLVLILFAVGFITWLFERKRNSAQFGDGPSKGLGSSFWWAAVTMTTVGYGDKAPITTGGRVIALIWMFAALIIISGITATITSALTVNQLDSKVKNLNDLYDVSVGTVKASSSQSFLKEEHVSHKLFESPLDAVTALENQEVDAVVYDAPILKHLIKSNNLTGKLKVLPVNLKPQYYGFAIPFQSRLTEDINRVLLKKVNTAEWKNTLFKYFGE